MKPIALLIEDSEGVAITWKRALEEIYEIKWADTLRKGVIMCSEIPPPKLILLDLRLGDSDDIATINAITTLQKLAPDCLVIVMSGYITPELLSLAIAKGAHGVHEKLSIKRSEDMWNSIQEAMLKAPPNVQKAAEFTRDIISRLTKTLHLL